MGRLQDSKHDAQAGVTAKKTKKQYLSSYIKAWLRWATSSDNTYLRRVLPTFGMFSTPRHSLLSVFSTTNTTTEALFNWSEIRRIRWKEEQMATYHEHQHCHSSKNHDVSYLHLLQVHVKLHFCVLHNYPS